MRTILSFTLGVSLTLLSTAAYAGQQSQAQETQSTAQPQAAKSQSAAQANVEKGKPDCEPPKVAVDGRIPLQHLCDAAVVAELLNDVLKRDRAKFTFYPAGNNNALWIEGPVSGNQDLFADLNRLVAWLDQPPKKDGRLVRNLVIRLEALGESAATLAPDLDKAIDGLRVKSLLENPKDPKKPIDAKKLVLKRVMVVVPVKPKQRSSIRNLRTVVEWMEEKYSEYIQSASTQPPVNGEEWVKKFVFRLRNLRDGSAVATALNQLVDGVNLEGRKGVPILVVGKNSVEKEALNQVKQLVGVLDRPAVAKKKDEGKQPENRVVQLFNLREATKIAEVLGEAIKGVKVKPIGQDLVVIMGAESKQNDAVDEIRRQIALIDRPRPQVTLQAWGVQMSAKKEERIHTWMDWLRPVVVSYNSRMRNALASGWEKLVSSAQQDPKAFFSEEFYSYVSSKYQDCKVNEQYCLGYWQAFADSRPSLTKIVLFLVASKDPVLRVEHTIRVMDEKSDSNRDFSCKEKENDKDKGPKPPLDGPPPLRFPNLGRALCRFVGPEQISVVRAAIYDFLFHYKWSIQYPHEFSPYELQRSADVLDESLEPLVDAFNRDIEFFVEGIQHLNKCVGKKPECWPTPHEKRQYARGWASLGIAPELSGKQFFSLGSIKVTSLSGSQAKVEGKSVSYFDVTRPPGGPGLVGSSEGWPDLLGSLAKAGMGPAQLATALAGSAAGEQVLAEVERGMKLTVTPTTLATASSAELDIDFEVGVDDAPSIVGKEGKKHPVDRVVKHKVKTTVRVDALKLFEVSTYTSTVHMRTPDGIFPVVGHLWNGLFGAVPGAGRLFKWRRKPSEVKHRSVVLVSAVIMPTAMDLVLGIHFKKDREAEGEKSFRKPPKGAEEFHEKVIECMLVIPLDKTGKKMKMCQSESLSSMIPKGPPPREDQKVRKAGVNAANN